jgi:hypothetical protein
MNKTMFKIGDIVKYTGKFSRNLINKKRIITEQPTVRNIKVKWDGVDIECGVYPENIEIYRTIPDEMFIL